MRPERVAKQFVEELSAISLPNVFNPYSAVCEHSDQEQAPAIRRSNLEQALCSALKLEVKSIWIAQDLGYRGGRRTGLALTDEAHLHEHGRMLKIATSLKKATHGPLVSERTATTIWHALRTIDQPVFLWNVFPLHPHLPADPFSNRCHKSAERSVGLHFLDLLLDALKPSIVVTIGEKATGAVATCEPTAFAVRHPSYGGQTDFLNMIGNIYGCAIPQQRDAFSSRTLNFVKLEEPR